MLIIDENKYIANGAFKNVYLYDDNKIIKVNKKKRFPLFKANTHILKIPNNFLSDLQREKNIFKNNNCEYFPKYYNFVKTNKGYGLIIECIKDYNDNLSKNIRYYKKNIKIIKQILNNLDIIIDFLYKNKFYVSDINDSNILVKLKNKNEVEKLVIIEGIYLKSKINLKYHLQKKYYKNKNYLKKIIYKSLDLVEYI